MEAAQEGEGSTEGASGGAKWLRATTNQHKVRPLRLAHNYLPLDTLTAPILSELSPLEDAPSDAVRSLPSLPTKGMEPAQV